MSRKCWLIVHPQPAAALDLIELAAPLADSLGGSLDWQQLRVCGGYAHQRQEQTMRRWPPTMRA
ncbi:MAG: hypothetical protein IPO66_21295 [Rhodanobacteraceae bacterium]|nr:hypothetical protein [Rhodanobacteraceae bacterium]